VYPRLILVLTLIAGLFLLLRWFVKLPPARVARAIRWLLFMFVAGLLLFLVATGRLSWLFALIASILPLLRRLFPLLRHLPWLGSLYQQHRARQSRTRTATGQTSNIETGFLRMCLDHDTGEMSGEVLEGTFKGRRLAELDLQQLQTLLQECQLKDTESVALLESFLERMYGDQWRQQSNTGAESRGGDSTTTYEEALQILGLKEGASREQIITAHRRLMQKVHPDRGGSDWMAAKLNRAKELLLG
jgi:hypothetical protein